MTLKSRLVRYAKRVARAVISTLRSWDASTTAFDKEWSGGEELGEAPERRAESSVEWITGAPLS